MPYLDSFPHLSGDCDLFETECALFCVKHTPTPRLHPFLFPDSQQQLSVWLSPSTRLSSLKDDILLTFTCSESTAVPCTPVTMTLFCLFFETGSHSVFQASLEFEAILILSLPSDGITGVYHHAWFRARLLYWGKKSCLIFKTIKNTFIL